MRKETKIGSSLEKSDEVAKAFLRPSMAEWEMELFGLTTYFFKTCTNASDAEKFMEKVSNIFSLPKTTFHGLTNRDFYRKENRGLQI